MNTRTAVFFYLLSLFLGLFLQIFVRNIFFTYSPNFLLLLVIYVALSRGAIAGEFFGFSSGVLSDIFSLNPFGTQAFLFTLIGYLAGRQTGKIDFEKPLAQVILVFLSSFIYFLGFSLITLLFAYGQKKVYFLPELLLNIFFAIPFFWLLSIWRNLWRQK